MLPTRRLFLVLLAAAPLGALGGAAVPAAAALVAVALCAALADWLLAADGRSVEVRREVEDKLALGDWNPIRLTLASGAARAIPLELRDVLPPDFEAQPEPPGLFAGVAPAGGDVTFTYRVRPRHRGDYAFGDLHLRVEGPLRLVRRSRRLRGTGRSVRVYPNLRQLRRYDLLARRGLSDEAGARAIRAPGAGSEFERLREYLPDDEFRRINWKATARQGKPIVNQLEAERSQNLVVMIDAGRLMGARAGLPAAEEAGALTAGEVPTGLTKLDHALNSALLLSYVASVRGDRVALLAYADGVRAFIPPARGRQAFLTVVQAFYNLTPEPAEPDHGEAFHFLAARNLRRSLVVLFTDLADRESSTGLVAHLVRAARQHMVVCVTLRDPTVARPALQPASDTPALYEKMVAQRLLEERAAVLAALRHRGVLSVDTDADKLTPEVVNTYLDLKQKGRI